jgi:hypothetical protein
MNYLEHFRVAPDSKVKLAKIDAGFKDKHPIDVAGAEIREIRNTELSRRPPTSRRARRENDDIGIGRRS